MGSPDAADVIARVLIYKTWPDRSTYPEKAAVIIGALNEAGYRIVKFTQRDAPPFSFADDEPTP